MTPQKKLAALIKTPTPFEKWLATQPCGAKVGKTHISESCPYATFLKKQGFTSVNVDGDVVLAKGIEVETPEWLLEFISEIDRDTDEGEIVPAHAAMTALQRAI